MMNLKYLLIAAMTAVFLPSYSQWDIKSAMESGVNAMEIRDFKASILFFSRVIESRPNQHKAFFQRGKAKYQLGDYTGCESDMSEVIFLNPFYLDAYEFRGLARTRLGKYASASEDFTVVTEHNTGRKDLLYDNAICSLLSGDFQSTDSICEQILSRWKSESNAYILQARAKYAMGKPEQSEQLIDKALINAPYNYEALAVKANFQMLHTAYSAAETTYSKALHVHPKDPQNLLRRGLCRLENGKREEALSDLRLSTELDPANTFGQYVLQQAMSGNIRDITGMINQLEERSDFVMPDYVLHPIYEESIEEICNDYELLVPQYLSDFQDEAYKPGSLFRSAHEHILQKRYREAIDELSQSLHESPGIPESYFNRAYSHSKLGDQEKALVDLDSAIRLRPNYANAYYNRGLTKLHLDNVDGALQDLSKAGELGIDYSYEIIRRLEQSQQDFYYSTFSKDKFQ